MGSDFNEDLMQAFAEVGAGAYAYLNDASKLATIFRRPEPGGDPGGQRGVDRVPAA